MAKRKKNFLTESSLWSRLLPETMQIYIARRLYDGWSIALMGIGVFLLLSLGTYHWSDPSMNTSVSSDTAQSIQNIFGATGALTSDFLIQSFGLPVFIAGFAFLVWGGRSLRRLEQTPFGARLPALCLSVLFLSLTAARIPSFEMVPGTYMGGGFGAISLNLMARPIGPYLGGWEFSLIASICSVLGAMAFLKAFEIPFANVRKAVVQFVSLTIFMFVTASQCIVSFVQWVRHHNDPDYVPPAWQNVKEKVQERFTKDKNPRLRKVAKKPVAAKPKDDIAKKVGDNIQVVKPKSGAKKAEKQGAFALDGASDWELPPLDFLQPPDAKNASISADDAGLRRNAEMLQSVLQDFNVEGDIVKIHPGPVVTLYEFEPAPGVKSSRVINLSDDIARSMAAISVRVAVIPGRNVIGIEMPNETRQTVYLRELLDTKEYETHKAKLPLVLGKDIGGQPIIADLARMPHLLVAGTTGSGKSVAINTMLMSLLYRLSPEQCRLIMIDPKMLELSVYDDIPHLLSPVVTEPGKAVVALKWTVAEMENRYRSMSKLGVRNIEGYNARLAQARKKGETLIRKVQTGYDPETGKPTFEDQAMDLTSLPYIVVVVDEFADLMLVAGKDVENAIQRLAQMARAAGIHIIMATQRPSVDVITGVVKANFPTRISFHVTSKIDSRTIIGEGGAEQLLGMGDMLFMSPGGQLKRVHGPFVADQEVEDVVSFLKQQGEPSYLEDITDGDEGFGEGSEVMAAMFGDGDSDGDKVDELYDQAVAIVAKERKASTSFIQRHLQIGYNRAARIIEEMEKQGVIGPANHVGKREVMVSDFSEA